MKTKHLILRLVEEEDAKFILELRQNPELNKHISPTKDSLEDQVNWIKKYKKREILGKEYYFRIDKKDGEQLGFVRVYNIENGKFTWGSWIIKEDNKLIFAALESALAVYEFAFKSLGLNQCEFDVRKDNKKVVSFHEKFGASKSGEDDINYYFKLSKDTYLEIRNKYKKFLNSSK